MLVLSRRIRQRIMIGDDIIVTVMEIGEGKVRLGIEAPMDTPIHREELFNRIRDGKLLQQEEDSKS